MSQSQVTNVEFYDESPVQCDLACRGLLISLIHMVMDGYIQGRLAGIISWDPPADVTGVTHYLAACLSLCGTCCCCCCSRVAVLPEVYITCSPDLSFENAGDGPLIVHYGPGGSPPAGVCSLTLILIARSVRCPCAWTLTFRPSPHAGHLLSCPALSKAPCRMFQLGSEKRIAV